MRPLLAIFVILMGLQSPPLQACERDAAAPPAHHAGHGAMDDPWPAAHDCCDAADSGLDASCADSLDCNPGGATTPAVSSKAVSWMLFTESRLRSGHGPPPAWQRTLPPYRPPIA